MKKAGEQKFKKHFISLITALDCFYKAIPSDQTLSERFFVLYFEMESKMTEHTEFSARYLLLCGCKVKYLSANTTKTR